MWLNKFEITPGNSPAEIVRLHHHTADVFKKYGIEYCCNGRWPIETICRINDIDYDLLRQDLEKVSRPVYHSARLSFDEWDIDFLTQYIINVHHGYLRNTLPGTEEIVSHFAEEHKKKYPQMQEVARLCRLLSKEILQHIAEEEKTIFPYICQVVHAYENKDSYAKLLVRTLRKPLDKMMANEQQHFLSLMIQIRSYSNNYVSPDSACTSHRIALSRLKELDNDIMQHIYLENNILFPRAIKIEQELLT